MSELDKQLAALKEASDAQAATLVAEAKAKENAATFTDGGLTDAELSAKVSEYHHAVGTSAPHPAVPHLFGLIKHLFARVNVLDKNATPIDTPSTVTTAPGVVTTTTPTTTPVVEVSSATTSTTPATNVIGTAVIGTTSAI